MRVTIRQKDIEITPALHEYIKQKIVRPVEKFLKREEREGTPLLDIEVARTTRHHKKGEVYRVSVSLTLGKKLIRAEVENEDVHAACDVIEDELKRKITSYKTRAFSMFKRMARRVKKELRFDRAARLFRKGRDWHEGN
ncbi:MAG: ribosomal subunit interface protein [Parcubacteria group bacterium Gr01-1014_33]|nr:MAG: ribosomal subunit interface protein [Parcubacteria group bacterium Gr01-1014_33]